MAKEILYTDKSTIYLTYDEDNKELNISLNSPAWYKDTKITVSAWKDIKIENISTEDY